MINLRGWQEEAASKFWAHPQKDFLLVASPGAGKTLWTCHNIRQLIDARIISRFVVVVLTTHLKEQWAKDAVKCGLNLDEGWRSSDGLWPADADGVVLTYGALERQPDVHRMNVARQPAAVVLDEVHHLDENKAWGAAAGEAFESAVRRIHLSGTPWRTEGRIPWLRYDSDGQAIADFEYTYREAVNDGVCCAVYFPHYEGEATWEVNGQRHSRSFRDKLDSAEESLRWKAVLDPSSSDYLRSTLIEADTEISAIRATIPNAGGMVLAKGQDEAREIANLMEELHGKRPVLVTSEEPRASAELKRFAKKESQDRWVVSVRMISEGVDIPRLRVLVWATPARTPLFFRQAMGRITRGDTPPATTYIPDIEPLPTFAKTMMDERDQALHIMVTQKPREGDFDREPIDFEAVGTDAQMNGVINPMGTGADRQQWEWFSQQLRAVGATTAVITKAAELYGGTASEEQEPSMQSPPPTQREQKEALKKSMRTIITRWAYGKSSDAAERRDLIRQANIDLNKAVGVKGSRSATLVQLQRRRDLAEEWYVPRF